MKNWNFFNAVMIELVKSVTYISVIGTFILVGWGFYDRQLLLTDNLKDEINQSLAQQEVRFDESLAQQEVRFDEKLAQQEVRFDEKLVQQEVRFDKKLAQQEERFMTEIHALNASVNQRFDDVDDRFDSLEDLLRERLPEKTPAP